MIKRRVYSLDGEVFYGLEDFVIPNDYQDQHVSVFEATEYFPDVEDVLDDDAFNQIVDILLKKFRIPEDELISTSRQELKDDLLDVLHENLNSTCSYIEDTHEVNIRDL